MRTKMWHIYTMSMLPELVSPRHLSGQKIREIDSDVEYEI